MQLAEPVAASWKASLALQFDVLDHKTFLSKKQSEGPLVVQKPLYPEGPEVCHVIVVHPPGGVAGGDELTLDVNCAQGSAALLTTPGAGKWYRSAGPRAKQSLRFDVAGTLEWLPRETIVFDGALAELDCEIRLAPGARFIGWEVVCLGRTGSGERFRKGKLKLESRVTAGGKPVWLERGTLEGASALMDSPVGLAGRTVFGTVIAASPELGGLQVARYLGDSTEEAFQRFTSLWKELRPSVVGRPGIEPRIWST